MHSVAVTWDAVVTVLTVTVLYCDLVAVLPLDFHGTHGFTMAVT